MEQDPNGTVTIPCAVRPLCVQLLDGVSVRQQNSVTQTQTQPAKRRELKSRRFVARLAIEWTYRSKNAELTLAFKASERKCGLFNPQKWRQVGWTFFVATVSLTDSRLTTRAHFTSTFTYTNFQLLHRIFAQFQFLLGFSLLAWLFHFIR
jgi:hypothetical protein